MKKYKLLIVEDEPEPLKRLLTLLKEHFDVIDENQIKVATSFADALKIISNSNGFDFSILDRKLDEGETCLTLMNQINIDKLGIIVLNTINEYDQKVMEEYQITGDYKVLGKPFTRISVAKLISEIVNIKISQNEFKESEGTILDIGNSGELIISDFNNILFVEGSNKYCHFYIFENNVIKKVENVSGTVDDQMLKLHKFEIFLRVHKSYIVNVKKIKLGKKDQRTTGWLSFTDEKYDSTKNSFVARYSNEHENYLLLKDLTGFKKI